MVIAQEALAALWLIPQLYIPPSGIQP